MKNYNDSEILKVLRKELKDELLGNILPYWMENTIDQKKGGFYGRITFDNEPVTGAEKGLILHARILWTFSAAYRRFIKPEIKEIADRAYRYLIEHFWDNEFSGMYWMVDAEGNVSDSRKHIYAEAFAVYALAEYYGASGNPEALDLAKELYNLIEKYSHDDENQGYYEAFTQNWKPLDDVRLSEKDDDEAKSMNTHLHVLEAYTNLYRYWKTPELKRKLTGLIEIFGQKIISKEKASLICFFDEDWTPKSDEVSFGHDIESSWLILEAAEVLGDYKKIEKIKEISLRIARFVLENGVDKDGGLFNEANSSEITDTDKDWWPQAEAVVGFINAYELTGAPEFLNAACNSWSFIKKFVIDKKHGEWHEKVKKNGEPYRLDKVRPWKCPYHNGRMTLEILRRTEEKKEQSYSA